MSHFLDTTETVADGLGFALFDSLHLLWLAVCVIAITACSVAYKRLKPLNRSRFRKIIAWLLVADELFKMAILILGGNYATSYLPLHLCSINIFVT